MRSVAEILKEVSAKALKQSSLQAATERGMCFYLLQEGWDLTDPEYITSAGEVDRFMKELRHSKGFKLCWLVGCLDHPSQWFEIYQDWDHRWDVIAKVRSW